MSNDAATNKKPMTSLPSEEITEIHVIPDVIAKSYLTKEHRYGCRRRVPRARINAPASAVRIRFPEICAEVFSVSMIAELGAQLVTPDTSLLPRKGDPIYTWVEIDSRRFAVKSRVVFAGGNFLTSLEFVNPPPSLRELVRNRFSLELKAASLVPIHSYTSTEAGPTHTTIYSDGDGTTLELAMHNRRLDGFACELGGIDLKFRWSRMRAGELRVKKLSQAGSPKPEQEHRELLMAFIQNLPELDIAVRRTLEMIAKPVA